MYIAIFKNTRKIMLKFFKAGFLLFFCFTSGSFAAQQNNVIKALELNQSIDKKKKNDSEIINPNFIQSGQAQTEPTRQKPKEVAPEVPIAKSIVADFQKWTVLTANPKGKKMCYAVVYSTKRIGNITGQVQDKAYFMVHYFSEIKDRVSVSFGYHLKKGSRIFISLDGVQFELVSCDGFAFSDSAEMDSDIISYLLTSKRLLIRGEGDGNTYSVDEYNISGFANAYNKMKQECSGLL